MTELGRKKLVSQHFKEGRNTGADLTGSDRAVLAFQGEKRYAVLPQLVCEQLTGVNPVVTGLVDNLAAMGTRVPDRGQQCLRYYGFYANSPPGRLRKPQQVGPLHTVLQPEISSEQFRKSWARLVQKVFEVDPLVCSHCQGRLRVVSFMEEPVVIRKILEHLGLWLANAPGKHS